MSDLVCRRCGNAMEWRTVEFQPGGNDFCWQCETRAARGLPQLPIRPLVPPSMVRVVPSEDRVKRIRVSRTERWRPYWMIKAEEQELASNPKTF